MSRGDCTRIAHAEELAYQSKDRSDADIERYVELARSNRIALTATLTLDERILEIVLDPSALDRRPELAFQHPAIRAVWLHRNPCASAPERFKGFEQVIGFNRRLVLAFVRAGIPVLAGTGSLIREWRRASHYTTSSSHWPAQECRTSKCLPRRPVFPRNG